MLLIVPLFVIDTPKSSPFEIANAGASTLIVEEAYIYGLPGLPYKFIAPAVTSISETAFNTMLFSLSRSILPPDPLSIPMPSGALMFT